MVIFVCGEDNYRVGRKTRELVDAFTQKFDTSGLNVDRRDGEKITPEQLADAIRTQPFLSAKRMVVVRGLLGRKLQKSEEAFVDALKAHAADTVVLCADTLSAAALTKHALRKAAGKEAIEYLFPLLKAPEVKQWILAETQVRGVRIEPGAADALAQMVGADLERLSHELDKLAAYVSERPISRDDVSLLVERHAEENIFALTDALGNRQAAGAARLLEQEYEAGSDPLGLFAMLARQVRLLIATASYLGAHPGAGSGQLAEALALHPFVAQKTLSQAKRYSWEQLVQMHGQLSVAERSIKTGRIRPEDVLRDFLAACAT